MGSGRRCLLIANALILQSTQVILVVHIDHKIGPPPYRDCWGVLVAVVRRAKSKPVHKGWKKTFCPYYIVVLQPHECISQCNACGKANKTKKTPPPVAKYIRTNVMQCLQTVSIFHAWGVPHFPFIYLLAIHAAIQDNAKAEQYTPHNQTTHHRAFLLRRLAFAASFSFSNPHSRSSVQHLPKKQSTTFADQIIDPGDP
jgi:hypothetical protein